MKILPEMMSNKAYNVLMRNGINTTEQLHEAIESNTLPLLRGCGAKTVAELTNIDFSEFGEAAENAETVHIVEKPIFYNYAVCKGSKPVALIIAEKGVTLPLDNAKIVPTLKGYDICKLQYVLSVNTNGMYLQENGTPLPIKKSEVVA